MKSREVRRREAWYVIAGESGAVVVLLLCLVIIDESSVKWLNTNSGAVVAMVTTVYTIFTILLWQATRTQAEITRQAFEASHRPFLSVRAEEPTDRVNNRLLFNLVFETHGLVPATITAWDIQGALTELDGQEQLVKREHELVPTPQEAIPTPVGRSLAPHEQVMVAMDFISEGLPNPPLPFWLRGWVEYQGSPDLPPYRTEFKAMRVGEMWQRQSYRIM